jgi:hypothetical protein
MVNMPQDRGFKPGRVRPKTYETSICCFSTKHTVKEKEQKLVGSESG